MPVKINYKIYQGSTFNGVLRWESPTLVYKPITGITKAAPTVLDVVGHGMPAGWRFQVSNVLGMKEINSEEFYTATSVTADSVTINSLNSLGFSTYTSGGVVSYYEPVALAGVTARMQIREKLTSTDVIDELTTENGKIVIDANAKTITILIDALDTAAYTFNTAVYSLEVTTGGVVVQLSTGTLTLVKEVTR